MSVAKTNVVVATAVRGEIVRGLELSLPAEHRAACIENIQAIEHIERYQTLESLKANGEWTLASAFLVRSLSKRNINGDLLTVAEAEAVLEYASNSTQDIKEQKISHISEVLTKVINGVREYRDYGNDPHKSRIVRELLEKSDRYARGEIDMSRKFDISMYPKKKNRDYIDLYGAYSALESVSSFEEDEYGGRYDSEESYSDKDYDVNDDHADFMYCLNNYDDDELLEGGYIDEEDLFVYGPYTMNDIRNIRTLAFETWASVSDQRNLKRLDSILSEITSKRSDDIETDLIKHYVSEIVLSNRRPFVTNLLRMVASFGQRCLNEVLNEDPKTEREEKLLLGLRKRLQLCSYYMIHICGFKPAKITAIYKKARPVDMEFYKEVLDCVDSWSSKSENQVKGIDKDFNSYLLKLDDYLLEIESLFKNIKRGRAKAAGTTNKSGQLLLGGLLNG